ncbi:MAG: hypothetical protein WCD18_11695 [Thermosynechococcaceae cyanobacterium]
MIRIEKPKSAPKKLAQEGKAKTDSHIQDYNLSPQDYQSGNKKFNFDSNIYGDRSVKEALILAQHKKCCFCERLIGDDGDVEHFRPKSAYKQKGNKLERPGYFWLAYDWDNLYLSCGPCNQRQKRNLFPLVDPAKRAQLQNNDIALEDPLFVDPGKEEPSHHIGFRGETPYPIPDSIKGKTTISSLKLDRDILNDARLRHLQTLKTLYQLTEVAIKQPQNKTLQDLAAEAEKALQDAISDQAEFAAATRAALQDQFKYVLE